MQPARIPHGGKGTAGLRGSIGAGNVQSDLPGIAPFSNRMKQYGQRRVQSIPPRSPIRKSDITNAPAG